MRDRTGAPAILSRLAAAAALVGLALQGSVADAGAQELRTVTMSRQHTTERALDVDVEFGAGTFAVRPAESGLLYRIQLRYDEEEVEPSVDYDDGFLSVGVERLNRGFRFGRNRSGTELELELTRDAVLDLDLEFGAVHADVELGGLSLSNLELATGASESTVRVSSPNPVAMERARIEAGAAHFRAVSLGNLNAAKIDVDAGLGEIVLDFGGEWQRDAEIEVDMGIGSLELVFPRSVGVRLEEDSFLSSLDAQEMIRRGDAYFSSNWETAEHRLTVMVDSALGRVDIRWIP